MFTGIIESLGILHDFYYDKSNLHIIVESEISKELKIDQSIAHNGVCLTVVECSSGWHRCTLIHETLVKTNFANVEKGDFVNLERCLRLHDRIDGHFVQGHVDTTASITDINDENGSWTYKIKLEKAHFPLIVPKGSIAINGVSLTISNVFDDGFQVSIIPYTHQHTTFSQLKVRSIVNLEFDILGKYLNRMMTLQIPDYLMPR